MLPLPAGREARSGVGTPVYTRHLPERTLLYQIVKEYNHAFVSHPGCLEHGFLRMRCDSCHAEHLVAFSCKRRGFCPRCGARRMAESAALLADAVLPANMSFIPDRLAALYNTRRPIFPLEKIGGGKGFDSTPAGICVQALYLYTFY